MYRRIVKLWFVAGLCCQLLWSSAFAQVPTAAFSSSAGCIQENLLITNTSSNADTYAWDFCANDFSNLKFSGSVAVVSGMTYGTAFKMVENNGQWTGFALAWYTDKLLRFDFGNSPLNSPTITNLGNPGGILSFPESIELVQQNGSWFAFVTNIDVGVGVILLDFGTSLTNTPTTTNLGNFGTADRIFDTRVVKQGADYILVLAKGTTNQIVRVNFRDSFYNTTTGYIYSDPVAGASFISGIDVTWSGSSWKVLVASYNTNEIYQLNFGTDLQSTPTKDAAYASIVNNPNRVAALKQADEFFVMVSGAAAGDLRIMDFNNFDPANPPSTLSYTSITGLLGLQPFRYKGMSVIMGVGASSNLNQLLFEAACGASATYVTVANPTGINYNTSGIKKIELTASSSISGASDRSGANLTISANTSPDIDFTSQNVCVNAGVNFSSVNSSGNVTAYSWNFGDSGTGTGSTTGHTYTNAATYPVTLTVTGSNGCFNRAQKNLQIFNPPQAGFNLPSASPVCTNQNYLFVNTSTGDAGASPTWQWSVNGSNVATTQDLNYLIPTASAQIISLAATIPGCTNSATQNISTVLTGPLVSFDSPPTGCAATALTFTNTTSGATTGFTWTLGDGSNSTQPLTFSKTYTDPGVYLVSLNATNAAGCQNTASKTIPVYSLPQPDFAIEGPPSSCANFQSQFDNNTLPLTDSNITDWAWDFGDPTTTADISGQKSPVYTYLSASTFQVSLTATSNFGCANATVKGVTILASPQASFASTPACVNQITQLTDNSTGSSGSSQWIIEGTSASGSVVSYTFKNPGNYPVTITATGANKCKNVTTQNIFVPVVPALDFTTKAPCPNNATSFDELNPGGADPAASWSWGFGTSGGVGTPVTHTFVSAGNYAVTMTTTRQSGCVYSITKSVAINVGPRASFSPSTFAGAAPLVVTFTNTSTAEDSIAWQFGDPGNTTSAISSPQFTYLQLGRYKPILTAFDTLLGCRDTTSVFINVVIPRIDLAVTGVSLVANPSTQSSKAVVTILNSGNIAVTNPEVLVNLAGNDPLTENIVGTIQPGRSLQQALAAEIATQTVSYICVAVKVEGDVDMANDQQCIPVTSSDVVMSPYPNPARGEINLDWVSASDENVLVMIYKSNGDVAFEQTIQSAQSGINQLTINTSTLANGLYLIQFSGAKIKKTFRFMVAN